MNRPTKHIDFLDHLRGIAILAVFLFHCAAIAVGRDQLPWAGCFRDFSVPKSFLALLPATYGWAGVSMFFVVSGFCIHLSFVRGSPGDWRGFYLRRFFRIYPPYLVAVLFFAVLYPGTRLSFHSLADWGQALSHLFLIHNFEDRFFFGLNPSFWSIAVEAQLYLIYPLLLAIVSRLGWKHSLWVVGALEIAMRCIAGIYSATTLAEAPYWLSGSPFFYWFSWAIGAALADAFMEGRVLPFASSPATLWGALAIGSFLIKPLVPFSFILFSVFAAIVVARKLRDGQSRVFLPAALGAHLARLGTWSYSVYLLHQPLIAAFAHSLRKWHLMPTQPLAAFAICVATYPFIFAVSGLFYRYCEKPGIALGRYWLDRSRSKLVPLSTAA